MNCTSYYYTYYPRYDLFTNELITFKSKDYYFTHDFDNRENFKNWIQQETSSKIKQYSMDFLTKRKMEKNLIYAMSQVELRSLLCPSIIGYDKYCGDYYKLCYALGFRVKYERYKALPVPLPKENYSIIIDSREQEPLKFNLPTKVATLNVGDYGYGNDDNMLNVFIERKSLNDFIGTLSSGFDRFNRELERAVSDCKKVVVVVEMDLKYALVFQRFISFKTKITPEYIFHNVRELIQTYPNIQFLFVKDRFEASRVIQKIFSSEGELLRYDLQLLQDTGAL